jgi:hypothetical protein
VRVGFAEGAAWSAATMNGIVGLALVGLALAIMVEAVRVLIGRASPATAETPAG